ncbi:hypothetical protein QVD17_00245 [Tagetes erecta]|uniref:Uncharacterized protein n=1 Tax=Tagetes erecta TaxID=13708 RepID=A0AAD8L9U1_TARER|nr:hypothetical protein QVD17_00245 [Tagetes erecta]
MVLQESLHRCDILHTEIFLDEILISMRIELSVCFNCVRCCCVDYFSLVYRIKVRGNRRLIIKEEEDMSSSSWKVEVIKEAIKQLMMEEEEEVRSIDDDDNHHRRLLSKLMSQLEKLEAENSHPKSESESEEEEERIVKEIKKVRRQNMITHCLVSVMILLTLAWQISEVSIILKLKNGVTHPFRSLGTMLKRIVVKPKQDHNAANDDDNDTITNTITGHTNNFIDHSTSMLHDLKLPNLQLPPLDFHD